MIKFLFPLRNTAYLSMRHDQLVVFYPDEEIITKPVAFEDLDSVM